MPIRVARLKKRRALCCFLVLAAASALLASGSLTKAVSAAELKTAFLGFTFGDDGTENLRPTRFVIGLPKHIKFRVFALRDPNRVIVELPSTRMQLPGDTPNADSLVESFRGGRSAPGKSRVVINVKTSVVVQNSQIIPDPRAPGRYQLAIDIVPFRDSTGSIKSAEQKFGLKPSSLGAPLLALAQPPLPKPAVHPRDLAKRAFKPLIVIDPGHGGRDTGAKKHGTVEKNVVLKFALQLREALEATGRYRILMTRETDVFITLDGRREFAERNNASLFIAVHADYASTNARGATIYSLRSSVADRLKSSTRRVAGRSVLSSDEVETVRSAAGDVSAVRNILSDLARREVDMTSQRTSMFARSVIQYMGESTNLRSHPDKSAAFRVLKTAKFPSVLIELAYVSNRKDAALLQSDTWREKVADSIVTAVDNYFGSHAARIPM